MARFFFALIVSALLSASTGQAERLRVALYTMEMERKGPGLLLRDILSGKDAQVTAATEVIAEANPDVLVLLRFDYDLELLALDAFADALATQGVPYPYSFALRPNTGLATGLDIDRDGRLGDPRDAQGYGMFSGQSGMAVLSRLPIFSENVQDLSTFAWSALPGASQPRTASGDPFWTEETWSALRLASVAHWVVPLHLPDGDTLELMAFHAAPPVFDGPEDRNGLRNRDQLRFWQLFIDGQLDHTPPAAPFVLVGNANIDPEKGEGDNATLRVILNHRQLQDPEPACLTPLSGLGPTDTVDWPALDGPGPMRVGYILPSADLGVLASGMTCPGDADTPDQAEQIRVASRHNLIWVDLDISGGS